MKETSFRCCVLQMEKSLQSHKIFRLMALFRREDSGIFPEIQKYFIRERPSMTSREGPIVNVNLLMPAQRMKGSWFNAIVL